MKENNTKDAWWRPGVLLFTKVSASTVVPIVLALIVGKRLDVKYHTAPWIFLGLSALAFLISLIAIWKHLSAYMKNLEEQEKNKK